MIFISSIFITIINYPISLILYTLVLYIVDKLLLYNKKPPAKAEG